MLNLSFEILKKDTSFPGTEREGVVASGGVGMTLVSKIVCHWQRQKNKNVAQFLGPVILGITLISKNSSCVVIMFLTFILLKKNNNNKTKTTRH